MRIQRPAADMFSLSLQVVGKNVSSSKRACVGRVVLLTFCSTYLLLLGNAAFALLPLCVARDLGWCDHDNPGGTGTTLRTAHCCTHVLGAPASIIGWELLQVPSVGLRLFASPRPDALSPPPLYPLWRAQNTRRYGHPLAGGPGRSGWGYAAPQNGCSRPSSMNSPSRLK